MEQGSIVGLFGCPEPEATLERALAALRRRGGPGALWRGPDLAVTGCATFAQGLSRGDPVTLVMDGALVDAALLAAELDEAGALRQSGEGAGLLLQLLHRSPRATPVNRLVDALGRARGGWAVLLSAQGHLAAARDPNGLRPLAMGRLGRGHVFASETGALAALGATAVRPLEPGELVIVDDQGAATLRPLPPGGARGCLREALHLARGDARLDDGEVWAWREARGAALARPEDGALDAVVSAGEAADGFAFGLARALGVPLIPALLDGGRAAPSAAVSGRRLALVTATLDDPAGVAARVATLRAAGAAAVLVRSAAPPPLAPCPYGVRAPAGLAAPLDAGAEGLATAPGAEGLSWPAPGPYGDEKRPCDGCFTGSFPVASRAPAAGGQLALFQPPRPKAL